MLMGRFGRARCQRRSSIARARANDTDMAHAHASRHSQPCSSRGASICSRQELDQTPRHAAHGPVATANASFSRPQEVVLEPLRRSGIAPDLDHEPAVNWRSTSWVGLLLIAHGKCSMSCEKRVEKQLLHAFLHMRAGGSGGNGSNSAPMQSLSQGFEAAAIAQRQTLFLAFYGGSLCLAHPSS